MWDPVPQIRAERGIEGQKVEGDGRKPGSRREGVRSAGIQPLRQQSHLTKNAQLKAPGNNCVIITSSSNDAHVCVYACMCLHVCVHPRAASPSLHIISLSTPPAPRDLPAWPRAAGTTCLSSQRRAPPPSESGLPGGPGLCNFTCCVGTTS